MPQVLPGFLSYALLRFEINVRSSTIIGFVGAGGIGQELKRVIGFNIYEEVSAICILILLIVVAIDLTSERMRHRFIGDWLALIGMRATIHLTGITAADLAAERARNPRAFASTARGRCTGSSAAGAGYLAYLFYRCGCSTSTASSPACRGSG